MQNKLEINSLIQQLNNIINSDTFTDEDILNTINILEKLFILNCDSNDLLKIELENLCIKTNDINYKNKEVKDTEIYKIIDYLIDLYSKIDGEYSTLNMDHLINVMTSIKNLKVDNIIMFFKIIKYKNFNISKTKINIENIIKQINKIGKEETLGYYNISDLISNLEIIFDNKKSNLILETLDLNNLLEQINKKDDFNAEELGEIFHGLEEMNYKKEELETLDLDKIIEQINKEDNIYEFTDEYKLNHLIIGLSNLDYTKDDLENLNLNQLLENINKNIKKFDFDELRGVFVGLIDLNYTKKDLTVFDLKLLIDKLIQNDNCIDVLEYKGDLLELNYTEEDLMQLNLYLAAQQVAKMKKTNNHNCDIFKF